MFYLKKIAGAVLMPYPLCLGLMGAGLILLWFTGRQREGGLSFEGGGRRWGGGVRPSFITYRGAGSWNSGLSFIRPSSYLSLAPCFSAHSAPLAKASRFRSPFPAGTDSTMAASREGRLTTSVLDHKAPSMIILATTGALN